MPLAENKTIRALFYIAMQYKYAKKVIKRMPKFITHFNKQIKF